MQSGASHNFVKIFTFPPCFAYPAVLNFRHKGDVKDMKPKKDVMDVFYKDEYYSFDKNDMHDYAWETGEVDDYKDYDEYSRQFTKVFFELLDKGFIDLDAFQTDEFAKWLIGHCY